MHRYHRILSEREGKRKRSVYAYISACAAHVSSINPESSCTPSLPLRLEHTIYNRSALSPPLISSARHRRFLQRSPRCTPVPSFPGFFLDGRNHRFSTLVLAPRVARWKTFSLLLARRSSWLEHLRLSGTHGARGGYALYATHIAYGPEWMQKSIETDVAYS